MRMIFLKSMGKIADRLWKMKNASMKTCALSIVLKSVYAQRVSHIKLSPWSWLSLLPLWHSEIQIKLCLLFISCFFTVVHVIACVVLLAKMSAIHWVLWLISFQSQQQAILSLGEKQIMWREQTIPNKKMYWQTDLFKYWFKSPAAKSRCNSVRNPHTWLKRLNSLNRFICKSTVFNYNVILIMRRVIIYSHTNKLCPCLEQHHLSLHLTVALTKIRWTVEPVECEL